jgi:DNA-binding transcriptional LysR family regulator
MQFLRLFCEVARLQSFSRAAVELGITQSAASQRVSQLERRLGINLFDRTVRPLALTPAGEIFLREGRELLSRYEALEQRVSQLQPTLHGQVTVDAIYSAGIDLLNHIRSSFIELHPDATVTVNYKQPDEVYDSVHNDHCDFGIVSYPQSWRDVGVIPIRDERMAVVVSPRHLLAEFKHVPAAKLQDMPMAAFEPELPVGRAIRRYFRDQNVTVEISSTFDNIDTIKSAVELTNQFAILPKRAVAREVLAGTLVVVDLDPKLDRPLGIIYRKRKSGNGPFSPVAQAFVNHLLEHAGPNVDIFGQIQAQSQGAQAGAMASAAKQAAKPGVKPGAAKSDEAAATATTTTTTKAGAVLNKA